MKKLFLTLISFTILLAGCRQDPPVEPSYVPGEVMFSLYDNSSFQDFYALVENLDLKISEAYNFEYLIKTSADSVDTIKSILRSKRYLSNGGRTFGCYYLDDTLHITANFFDPDAIDANDWFITCQQLQLAEDLNTDFFKWGILNVPVGKEQYWVDRLKQYSIIKSSGLNHRI